MGVIVFQVQNIDLPLITTGHHGCDRISGANSGVESGDSSSMDSSVRLSKRKRRPPSSLEDSPTSQSIGWAKSCLW